MLRIVATVNNRQTLFLGLDRTNTDRMHQGDPVVVDLQALTANIEQPVQDIVLCADETLADIHADLSRFLPLPPLEDE